MLQHRLSLCLMAVLTAFLGGCVTPNNSCGNEERDWDNLHFPKSRYCSVPAFLPFSDSYEAANKSVCKVHDNNSGIKATMPQSEADKKFLCDYMKHSQLPLGLRTITGYTSYMLLRLGAPFESLTEPDVQYAPVRNDDQQPILSGNGKPVRNVQPGTSRLSDSPQ